MKKVSALLVVLTMILFTVISCDKKTSALQEENSEAFDSAESSVYSGSTAVAFTHSVKDFDEWFKVYTNVSDPSSRLSIFVSPDDPNLITVFELTKSHEDARMAFASEFLKKALADGGVTSDLQVRYFDVKFREDEKSSKMYRLGVSHEVEEYDRWKKIFDEDEPIRAKAQLELRAISVDADNPHMIHIMFATDDIVKAKGVINSEELRKRMNEAGVRNEPMFAVYKVVSTPSGH